MNILILGSGGREHALSWKIAQSPLCKSLFIAPGNAGTANVGSNLPLSVDDFEGIKKAVISHKIDMVVIGPEQPLVLGLRDFIENDIAINQCMVIGPGKLGAQLEGSKDFSKAFMHKYGIPTAASATFTKENIKEGKAFLKTMPKPYVLKADGLAAGKGVIITSDYDEACSTLDDMLLNSMFGEASAKVVIEEFMAGIEASIFVLTDGESYKILPEAKDYKRIFEKDEGPNTGGMGAVSPVPFADANFMRKVEQNIVMPTLHGLKTENIPYVGFIFIGLMNVEGEPKVVEYNVRMGDPETEVVIPRIKSDLLELLVATAEGKLGEATIEVDLRTATTVMLVAGGYPGSYEKGLPISGLENTGSALVFHAGTKEQNGKIYTNGGRVIACTGMAAHMADALDVSNQAAEAIQWQGKFYRKDIGFDLV
jgi:phosphoribosylamine--glycine ligase